MTASNLDIPPIVVEHCSIAGGLDAVFVANGHRVRWQAVAEGRSFAHYITIDDDESPVVFRCGYLRMAEVELPRLTGAPAWAWELVGAVAWGAMLDRYEIRRDVELARSEGYLAGLRVGDRVHGSAPESKQTPCYVYLMRSGTRLKIGVARDPHSRLRELRVAAGPIELVAKRRFGSRERARAAESAAHAKFDGFRLHGEWFSDVPEIVEHFRGSWAA